MADIYFLLSRVVRERVGYHQRNVQKEIDKTFGRRPIPAGDETHARLMKELRSLKGMDRLGYDLVSHTQLPSIGRFIVEQVRASGLPAVDIAKLEPLAERWGQIAQTAWNLKEITDEALALISLDQDEEWTTYYKSVFGEEP